jgi:uncharacterized protein YdcH (DUF465 family)
MTTTDKELIEKVCAEDEEFKALYEDHLAFEEKIDDMLKRPPTSELHFEVETLKKQKLAGKDKMERILTRYR